MTPHSTRETSPSPSPFTTPYPVFAVPGSMPRMITRPRPGARAAGARSSLGPRHLTHVHVEVRPDFLDIVEVLEGLEQLEQRVTVLAADLHGVLRHHGELGLDDLDAFALQRFLHDMKVGRIR